MNLDFLDKNLSVDSNFFSNISRFLYGSFHTMNPCYVDQCQKANRQCYGDKTVCSDYKTTEKDMT